MTEDKLSNANKLKGRIKALEQWHSTHLPVSSCLPYEIQGRDELIATTEQTFAAAVHREIGRLKAEFEAL